MSQPARRPALISAVVYKDPKAALQWLQDAFGFEMAMLITDQDGNLAHSEMRFRNGVVMIGNEWSAQHRSPANLGGLNTQTVHVQMDEDIDAHCERARKAGAEILIEPETQFYGDRTYRARDPEGHIWTFGQTVTDLGPETWDQASGFKTQLWP
ncbi:glyoxalase [Caulobacter sp. CCUG 60055]|uniref:VOC family protein n=1 Tax=Caulobacter sp. CCUG 60055 TaxID=2100090 RepID=UPI001FA790A0|nr:VOC family protein [Caulobacter sp. CCUG 60055]MBQ1540785.1 VOC family protein [Caulobacteraceae bacterium]MCI3179344.1 glyoxalase [Caulobacter sp. CCUG 60055]